MNPVIGVVLMVAITTILAAVLGTFVLGMGQGMTESAPIVSLSIEADSNADLVRIQRNGGDGLRSSRTRVTVEIGDATATFDEQPSGVVLSVGSTARINASPDASPNNRIDWDGDGSYTGEDWRPPSSTPPERDRPGPAGDGHADRRRIAAGDLPGHDDRLTRRVADHRAVIPPPHSRYLTR